MKIRVLAFSIEKYQRSDLDKMTPVQLNEIMLGDTKNAFAYDYANMREFTNEINDGVVEADNYWFYAVENN